MNTLTICPTCRVRLAVDPADGLLRCCGTCGGTFRPGEHDLSADPFAKTEISFVDVPNALSCPQCLQPMQSLAPTSPLEHQCPACGGMWISPLSEAADELPLATSDVPPEPELPAFIRKMLYGISLPERLLRTMVGVTAGTSREVAALLVPQAFQSSKSYEVAVRNSLDFLTETIGGFPSPGSESPDSPQATDAATHIARKTVGNFVDVASLMTLHFSPLWILAAVSDAAYGSASFARELGLELQKQGLIDDASTIHNVDDILESIRKTSGTAASTLDRPPFSTEELSAVLTEARTSLNQADLRKLIPEREMRAYWNSLREIATRENVTLLEAATAVAMHAAQQSSVITRGGLTGFHVAGTLFDRNVLQHYRDGLDTLQREGFLAVVRKTYEPYVSQAWSNFSEDRKSWTESILDPNHLKRLANWPMQSWWGSKPETTKTSPSGG